MLTVNDIYGVHFRWLFTAVTVCVHRRLWLVLSCKYAVHCGRTIRVFWPIERTRNRNWTQRKPVFVETRLSYCEKGQNKRREAAHKCWSRLLLCPLHNNLSIEKFQTLVKISQRPKYGHDFGVSFFNPSCRPTFYLLPCFTDCFSLMPSHADRFRPIRVTHCLDYK